MTYAATKPRPADPDRMRAGLGDIRDALDALPDHHDFADMASFDAAFTDAIEALKGRFRALDRSVRITQGEEFCTVAAFGHVASSRLGFIGAVEKWARRVGRAIGEE